MPRLPAVTMLVLASAVDGQSRVGELTPSEERRQALHRICFPEDHITYERCCENLDITCFDDVFRPEFCCSDPDELLQEDIVDSRYELFGSFDLACWSSAAYSKEDCCSDDFNERSRCFPDKNAIHTFTNCCLSPEKQQFLQTPTDKALFIEMLRADLGGCPADLQNQHVEFRHSDFGDGLEYQMVVVFYDEKAGAQNKFWHHMHSHASRLHIAARYGSNYKFQDEFETFDYGMSFYQTFLSAVKYPKLWNLLFAECAPGLLTLVQVFLPRYERETSTEAAAVVYQKWKMHSDEVFRSTNRTFLGTWPKIDVPRYRHLLGLSPHKCPVDGLKLYLYNLTQYPHSTDNTLTCSATMDMTAISPHILPYIKSSRCVTTDPEEADLFIFPLFEAC